jgi:Icc protein
MDIGFECDHSGGHAMNCHRTGGLAALGWLLLPLGCLRPSEERVRQDLRVGQAALASLAVEVEDGRAAVRSLEDTRVVLWASAPRLRLRLTFHVAPPAEFSIDVQNCMPGAELRVEPRVAVLASGRNASGVCSYRIAPSTSAAALALVIEPPGSGAPAAFQFAVMSDVQEALPRVQDIYTVMNREPQIDFLLGAGDLTERGTRAQLERLKIPYYTTLGNHELGESPTLYHEYYGRGNQSFEYKGVRFTLLDSASATIDPIVFDWLDDWLALGRDRLHVVAMHVPPLDPIGVRNGAFASRNEAAKLLGRLAQAGVDLTLYGHIHSYYSFDNAGIAAHISGGGGAIPEKFDDIGRHFLVVDADPREGRLEVRIVRVD